MNSARERAVEAGVKQFHHEVMGDQDLPWDAVEPEIQASVTACIRRVISAAFPIQAEELVAWHDEAAEALEAKRQGKYRYLPSHLASQLAFHRQSAHVLRARIQQMAEAGHE